MGVVIFDLNCGKLHIKFHEKFKGRKGVTASCGNIDINYPLNQMWAKCGPHAARVHLEKEKYKLLS